ncbi:uncharacterized protein LOC114247948 [Bombyx mandarina]|uniref:Uncharacterized protein LOC114247948 n=1 Tax=Bombyx mandarina TaxID=7092 RepID=A0A6J2K953_BOMMA|nr:uncharacterized protein LOC114247948 [Bombyx mandarina]
MKLVILLALCAVAAAAPKANRDAFAIEEFERFQATGNRNILINAIITTLFQRLRSIILEGWEEKGVPVLDPLVIESTHITIPAEIINLDLQLKNAQATGVGDFVVHKSILNVNEISFDVDISVPTLEISAEEYDLLGDFFAAIPLYGKGGAVFHIEGFRFSAKLFLKQSEDEKSILIERIENLTFVIPGFKSNLDGAVGGGDIDNIVNALVEEVIIDYVNRFRGAIAKVANGALVRILNSFLDGLNTWHYLAMLLPK